MMCCWWFPFATIARGGREVPLYSLPIFQAREDPLIMS